MVPFGQPPSLHLLRSMRLVRRFPRYYEAVRLPIAVHHWRASSDFPMRPPTLTRGSHGISRFPCKVSPYVLGVSDRAGSVHLLRYRFAPCCLPPVVQRRHPELLGFHGSIPGPHVPLSTLHPCSYEQRRMTRGRCGSLFLHRVTISFTTLHRF